MLFRSTAFIATPLTAGYSKLLPAKIRWASALANSSKPEDRAIAEKVGIIFPNQKDRGTHVNISGGGIAKFAPNRQAALQYLEYLASPEAQRIFAGSNFEYPVVSGVPMDAVLTGYGKFKADPLSARIIGQKNAIALKVMDRSGWT